MDTSFQNFCTLLILGICLGLLPFTDGEQRFCNHCKWNQSIFTCQRSEEYESVLCPPPTQQCLTIVGNFTAWNIVTSRYSVISGTQRVCLTATSAMNIAIKNTTSGCRRDVSTNSADGDWRFMFQGDYCICDGNNCNSGNSLIASVMLLTSLFWFGVFAY